MNVETKTRFIIGINAVFILTAGFVLNSFLNYKSYTLEENGKWQSTKTNLMCLPGAYANMLTKNALAQNHLDLSSWNGYQELIYSQPLKADSISFRYRFANKGCFSFIMHKSDSLTYGICFHEKLDSTCFLFIADNDGKFIYRKNFYLQIPTAKWWQWQEITIKRTTDSLFLAANGIEYVSAAFKTPDNIHFGFKGANDYTLIDDITTYDVSNKLLMAENFTPPFCIRGWAVLFLFFFAAGFILFFKSGKRESITALNMSILLGISAAYVVYFYYLSNRYITDERSINLEGKISSCEDQAKTCERIRSEVKAADKKHVVIFIGSSQTWGSGASNMQNSYPSLVEKNIITYFGDSSFTVINGALCGNSSYDQYKHYTVEWYKSNPVVVVIDLSNNDIDTSVFKTYIQKFIDYNHAKKIKTILIAEPNDFLNKNTMVANHAIMQQLGNKCDVPVIMMQQYLANKKNTGFVWCDQVHLTDYGQHLFANRISPEIIKELEQDSLVWKTKNPNKSF